MKKAPAGKKGYYVHLKEGSLYQIHYGREKDYSITFRARGKGKLQAGYYRYHYFPAEKNKLKYIDSKYPFPSIQLTDQWKEYRYEYHKQYDDEIFAPPSSRPSPEKSCWMM